MDIMQIILFSEINDTSQHTTLLETDSAGRIRSTQFFLSADTVINYQLITDKNFTTLIECAVLCLQFSNCYSFYFEQLGEKCALFSRDYVSQVTDLSGKIYFSKFNP